MNKDVFKFLIVGGTSTTIDFLIYILSSDFIDVSIAKGVSITVASIFSYLGNKFWTFKDNTKSNIKQLIKYCFVTLTNINVNIYVNYKIYVLCNNKIIAFVVATAAATVVNYCLQKKFVFKK